MCAFYDTTGFYAFVLFQKYIQKQTFILKKAVKSHRDFDVNACNFNSCFMALHMFRRGSTLFVGWMAMR